MIRKSLFTVTAGVLVISMIASSLLVSNANANTNYGLASDVVYLNKGAMTQSQIQSFLTEKNSSLATYKDQGINDSQPQLASTIIYNAAQAWGINPQVLLATMQKEQSLVTKQNPTSIDYRSAMGYGCPDGADCNASYYGFANQVNIAAYQFRYNYEALRGNSSFTDGDGDSHPVGRFACAQADSNHTPPFYNNALLVGNTVTFSRNTAISGTVDTTITIANEATASLLCYTPHVGPYNSTGYSGSDNFVYWFTQWFGSTQGKFTIDFGAATKAISDTYSQYKDALGRSTSDPVFEYNTDGRVWQNFENGTIIWTQTYGAYPVLNGDIFNRWKVLGGSLGTLGVPIGASVQESDGRIWQNFKSGTVIYTSSTGAWEILPGPIGDTWRASGGSLGTLGPPSSGVDITSESRKQTFENGVVIRKDINNKPYIVSSTIYGLWKNNTQSYGFPTNNPVQEPSDGRVWQNFENGTVVSLNGNAGFVSLGPIYNYWQSNGGSLGTLGVPTTDTTTESDGRVWQNFENGTVVQKNSKTPVSSILFGDLYDRWRQTGGSLGTLGVPTAPSVTEPDGRVWQAFEYGDIIWSKDTGAWDVVGNFFIQWQRYGGSMGQLGKPTGSRQIEPNGTRWQNFEKGRLTWSINSGWSVSKIN